jgi:hypothetical protein
MMMRFHLIFSMNVYDVKDQRSLCHQDKNKYCVQYEIDIF